MSCVSVPALYAFRFVFWVPAVSTQGVGPSVFFFSTVGHANQNETIGRLSRNHPLSIGRTLDLKKVLGPSIRQGAWSALGAWGVDGYQHGSMRLLCIVVYLMPKNHGNNMTNVYMHYGCIVYSFAIAKYMYTHSTLLFFYEHVVSLGVDSLRLVLLVLRSAQGSIESEVLCMVASAIARVPSGLWEF